MHTINSKKLDVLVQDLFTICIIQIFWEHFFCLSKYLHLAHDEHLESPCVECVMIHVVK